MERIKIALAALVKFLTETVPKEDLHPIVTDPRKMMISTHALFILEEFKKLESARADDLPREVKRDLEVVRLWFYA